MSNLINFNSLVESLPMMIVQINRAYEIEHMNYVQLHYKLEEVIGTSVFQYVAPEHHEGYKEKINYVFETGERTTYSLKVNHDEEAFSWFDLLISPIFLGKKINSIVVVTLDVTERKIAQEQLENALAEKEILLKEVHHRAKNNLQVLSSILNLHKDKTSDVKVIDVLEECKNSIQSLALAHECLYKSDDFSKVDFKDYINRFCTYFNLSVNASSKIKLQIELEKAFVSMDKAITSGLILSEILVNAFKHAFPNRSDGVVNVKLKKKKNKNVILVEDNGIGLPQNFNIDELESLGMELIRILVEQLEGEVEMSSEKGKGTKFEFSFE